MTTEKFDSTDDRRTENNTVRHQYRTLSEQEKQEITDIKDAGQHFLNIIGGIGTSEALQQARLRLEEAVFWACKHVTNDKK